MLIVVLTGVALLRARAGASGERRASKRTSQLPSLRGGGTASSKKARGKGLAKQRRAGGGRGAHAEVEELEGLADGGDDVDDYDVDENDEDDDAVLAAFAGADALVYDEDEDAMGDQDPKSADDVDDDELAAMEEDSRGARRGRPGAGGGASRKTARNTTKSATGPAPRGSKTAGHRGRR